jgi:hypothetical protein
LSAAPLALTEALLLAHRVAGAGEPLKLPALLLIGPLTRRRRVTIRRAGVGAAALRISPGPVLLEGPVLVKPPVVPTVCPELMNSAALLAVVPTLTTPPGGRWGEWSAC